MAQSFEERFWSKVDHSGGPEACWPWTGYRNRLNYGVVSLPGGKLELTHRTAYRLNHGPIPNGKKVLHRCDNRPCCNVAHHFIGTQADNIADMMAKGRHRPPDVRGVRHGSAKLDDERIREIRALQGSGESQDRIAARYGVSQSLVSLIWLGKIWTHVA